MITAHVEEDVSDDRCKKNKRRILHRGDVKLFSMLTFKSYVPLSKTEMVPFIADPNLSSLIILTLDKS